MVCYNEVTKKPTVKIDLSKAICVEDNTDPVTKNAEGSIRSKTPTGLDGRAGSRLTVRSMNMDEEPDESYNVERSFRITFADGERISFFADTDEDKAKWIKVLTGITETPVPPNPMWAQVALEMLKGGSTSACPSASGPSQGRCSGAVAASSVRKPSYDARTAPPTVQEESGEETPKRGVTPQRKPVPSMTGPPVPDKVGPVVRPVSHDPSGHVAFDRLRKAALASRSELNRSG